MMSSIAHATLTTIGTAGYDSDGSGNIDDNEWYNLIWEHDDDGYSLVWLDYSNAPKKWADQVKWVASLNGTDILTYNIDSSYTVEWGENKWRLPSTVDGVYKYGKDGTTTGGYNITTSELGHLFYVSLGNPGRFDVNGKERTDYGLKNTGDFENLIKTPQGWYWSDTEYSKTNGYAWNFSMYNGLQFVYSESKGYRNGIAVCTPQVSVSSVPVSGAILLLGSGLLGLAAVGRKKELCGHDTKIFTSQF